MCFPINPNNDFIFLINQLIGRVIAQNPEITFEGNIFLCE